MLNRISKRVDEVVEVVNRLVRGLAVFVHRPTVVVELSHKLNQMRVNNDFVLQQKVDTGIHRIPALERTLYLNVLASNIVD